MQVSRITQTKRGRWALFDEEGGFLFSLDGETLLKNHIAEGSLLSAADLGELRAQSETRKAKDKALAYLALRDHAAGELYDKLCRKFDPQSSAAAVAEMQRLGMIDDEAFARRRAAYLAGRSKSRREIEAHLLEKGIDRQTVGAVLEELQLDGSGACYAIVCKNYRSRLARGEQDKVLAALARRGFSYREARDAVERFQREYDVGEGSGGDDNWEDLT